MVLGIIIYKNPYHFFLELFYAISTFDFIFLFLMASHKYIGTDFCFLASLKQNLDCGRTLVKYDENCSHKLTLKFWGENGSGTSFENLKYLCLAKLLILKNAHQSRLLRLL